MVSYSRGKVILTVHLSIMLYNPYTEEKKFKRVKLHFYTRVALCFWMGGNCVTFIIKLPTIFY